MTVHFDSGREEGEGRAEPFLTKLGRTDFDDDLTRSLLTMFACGQSRLELLQLLAVLAHSNAFQSLLISLST